MDHFLNEENLAEILDCYALVHHDAYYVKMDVAWGISVACAKFPSQTITYLEKSNLDKFIHNKAIQKCCESYRVPPEIKKYLRSLKK